MTQADPLRESIDPDVASAMARYGIEYTVIDCDQELADTRDFCEHYGFSIDESANVLVVASTKGELKVAACVVLAAYRLDANRTVRKKLGVSRISFATPEHTRELTGMELGGVTPFGIPESVPLWIDSRVMACERIILGGGNRTSKIVVTPDMLLRIPHAEVVEHLARDR